jgi:hypothetical protein
VFRGDAFLLGAEHDGRTVSIVSTHVVAFITAQALKTCPNISLDVFNHMTDMDRAIGIGEGASNEDFSWLHSYVQVVLIGT